MCPRRAAEESVVGNGARSKSAHMVASASVQDAATLRLRLESLRRASQGPDRRIEALFGAVPLGRRLSPTARRLPPKHFDEGAERFASFANNATFDFESSL